MYPRVRYPKKNGMLFKFSKYNTIKKKFLITAMMYYPMNKDDLSKNKDYAVLLANRSAALENMNCYEAVIQDVDLAFKYGYPKELFFKVVY